MAEEIDKKAEIKAEERRKLPHVNFRFFVFAALSLCAGIALYLAIRLNRFSFFDFVPFILVFVLAFYPFSLKRLLGVLCVVICFSSLGVVLVHIGCERYLSGVPAGEYVVEGRVETFSEGNGYRYCVLNSLSFDGVSADGKMNVSLSDESVRAGDIVTFRASVLRYDLPSGSMNPSRFAKNIRYHAITDASEVTGKRGVLLLLNAKIYDCLQEGMERDEAAVGYALLTGNTAPMDEGLLTVAREGGIAHVFAVSGLHIGIVYSAVLVAFKKPLKRYAALPALALALCYSALCAFTVSSVRALIMCSVLSVQRFLGRKTDMVTSVSVAAVIVLILMPEQYISVGFTLSFGACVALALFSHTFARAFRKIKCPAFLADYLAGSLSVQLFTFPILLSTFGYASVWTFLLNFLLLPCLPVLLIALILCTLFSLVTTLTGALIVPAGMISLLLFVLSVVDTAFVVKGFSLGAGCAVIVTLCIVATQRFRLRPCAKAVGLCTLCAVFVAVVVGKNCVFTGCKLVAQSYDSGNCVLVQSPRESVLVIDGTIDLDDCNDFLNRHFGGRLNGVLVLSFVGLDAVNRAAFLKTDAVYVPDEIATGLRDVNVVFGEEVAIGELSFRYESRTKIVLAVQGIVTEIDFTDCAVLGADLFIDRGNCEYFLKDGKIVILP